MSKTLFVSFRDQRLDIGTEGFWAFDVVSGVFLKHLVDVATAQLLVRHDAWLTDAIEHWRFNAVCGDLGLFLNDSWTPEQIATFTKLAREACDVLAKRESIPAAEIESWQMVDGDYIYRCFARGQPFVTTASAIRFGDALIQLVNGELPEPPPGTWWFFGPDESQQTMGKRNA